MFNLSLFSYIFASLSKLNIQVSLGGYHTYDFSIMVGTVSLHANISIYYNILVIIDHNNCYAKPITRTYYNTMIIYFLQF